MRGTVQGTEKREAVACVQKAHLEPHDSQREEREREEERESIERKRTLSPTMESSMTTQRSAGTPITSYQDRAGQDRTRHVRSHHIGSHGLRHVTPPTRDK